MRSGDMGICASLCPPLPLSCWAPSRCCLSGLPLPVPTLEAPMVALVCGAERGGAISRSTIPVYVPCQATTGQVGAVLDWPKKGWFSLGK